MAAAESMAHNQWLFCLQVNNRVEEYSAMPVATRSRVKLPYSHKGFYFTRSHGRLYAIPPFLDPDELHVRKRLHIHPAVLSASTIEELEVLVAGYDPSPFQPEIIEFYEGYHIAQHGGTYYGIRHSAGYVDLNLEEEQRRADVIRGKSCQEIRKAIDTARQAVPVEFAGWLPVFEFAGNCGRHPQFTHTVAPPAGYNFTRSSPAEKFRLPFRATMAGLFLWRVSRAVWSLRLLARPFLGAFRGGRRLPLRDRCRTLLAVARLFIVLWRGGAGVFPILQFLQSRHFQSQALLANRKALVFLPSIPYTYNQNPWVIEIEDPTTLFYPHIQNGTECQHSIPDMPCYRVVRALLESEPCRGIITHMQSTARMVRTLFRSETITRKITYAPLGVRVPARWQHHEEDDPETIHILFTNSWSQIPACFYGRGGLDVLEAFGILHERYPQLRLTMRTSLPVLADLYHQIIETGWVRVIDRFLSAEEMEALHAQSHIFLLPAARVHIVSLLQAMSYGLSVVTSDGWGIEEYVRDEGNGLIVKGRYGKTSWVNEEAGILCENYDPTHTSDPVVVQGIVDAISRLVEDAALRRRLGHAARKDVEEKYNMEQWNAALKAALDKALAFPGHGFGQV
jgi:glycosyltransferase involved in cell wall biosynthesis